MTEPSSMTEPTENGGWVGASIPLLPSPLLLVGLVAFLVVVAGKNDVGTGCEEPLMGGAPTCHPHPSGDAAGEHVQVNLPHIGHLPATVESADAGETA